MSAAGASEWADLPPEVLVNISRRLHAAVDFVRFHAVCMPWRDAIDHYRQREPEHGALPWLLAPYDVGGDGPAVQHCRCVFSKTSYRSPGFCIRDRRVACASGDAAWLVDGGPDNRYALVNPLHGPYRGDGRCQLPAPSYWDERFVERGHRVVAGDDTIFLYEFSPTRGYLSARLSGLVLLPGHKNWIYESRGLGKSRRCCAVALYDGAIVVVDEAHCHIHVLEYHRNSRGTRAPLPDDHPGKVRHCSYLLEMEHDDDGGELLLASVLRDQLTGELSVSLHALDVKAAIAAGEGPMVWSRRDDAVIMSHVLFLGFPGSFAKEAKFGEEVPGGTAYFVAGDEATSCSVYRYSFKDGGAPATVVEKLPPGWNDARCMWFTPRPEIEPLDEAPPARRRRCSDTNTRQPSRRELTIYAGELSPKVDHSRLREMFSKHGKVAGARIAYDKRGRPRGFGFVTMATQEGFDNAMAALTAVVEEVARPASAVTRAFNFLSQCLQLV